MRTSVQISFGLFDVTALPDSTPQSMDKQPFVDMADLKRDDPDLPGKYATLEEDFFLLDGSFQPFPDNPDGLGWGYWSNSMSDAAGVFDSPPVMEFAFGNPHSSIGLTLGFDGNTGDYCRKVRVEWYDAGGTLITAGEFLFSGSAGFIDHPAEDYKKVVLKVLETSKPYRYAKITSIQYGSQVIFGKDGIVSAKINEEIDLTCSEISINTLDFTIHSEDSNFSLLNPKGAFSMLQQRQKLEVIEKVDGQPVPMGTFYLDSWKNGSEKGVTMSAIDIVGVIDKTDFMGGVYVSQTAETIISEIMQSAGAEYVLDESLKNVSLSGYIPVCTHRQALQQVAFAMGAIIDCSRSELVHIYPPPERPSSYISRTRKFLGSTVEQMSLVTGVDVTAHKYLQSNTLKELFEDELEPGNYQITFDKPVFNVQCNGGTILSSSANYAYIQVDSAGTVKLSGMEYTETTRVLSKRMQNLQLSDAPNIAKVEKATLTDSIAAKQAVSRLYEYYQNRYKTKFSMVTGEEKVGDQIVVDSLNKERLKGIIEQMEIDLAGGFLCSVTMSGKRIETITGEYTGEIYTGEWGFI